MGMGLSGIGGFNTDGIVQQLIALEKRPAKTLYDKQASIESSVRTYQSLNSQLSTLTSNAWAIYGRESKTDTTLDASAVWEAVSGKSSNDKVGVTTKAGATVGSVEFDVVSLANSKQVTFDSTQLKALTDEMGRNGSFSIQIGNKLTNITPKFASMDSIAEAINSAKDSGVSATVVKVGKNWDGSDKYLLQLTGKDTGAKEGNFKIYAGDVHYGLVISPTDKKVDPQTNTITYVYKDQADLATAIDGFPTFEGTVRRTATDAVIKLYGEEHTFASNTIEIMDKVDVDISKIKPETKADGTPLYPDAIAKGIKIDTVGDPSVATGKVKSLVDSVNAVFGTLAKGMKSVDKYRYEEDGSRTTWKAPGELSNAIGRQVQSQLADALSAPVNIKGKDGKPQTFALKDFGIELKADKGAMTLSFDADAFKELVETDPNRAEQLATVLAKRVGDLGSAFSDSTDGMITGVIKTQESEKTYYEDRINDFNARITRREADLKRQYSSLETILSKFSQQQAWLTSQLASLNGGGAQRQ